MDMMQKFIYKYRIAPKPCYAYTGIDLNVNLVPNPMSELDPFYKIIELKIPMSDIADIIFFVGDHLRMGR
jgi:hypothetical protein